MSTVHIVHVLKQHLDSQHLQTARIGCDWRDLACKTALDTRNQTLYRFHTATTKQQRQAIGMQSKRGT